ncbi:MAG: hypothetical protein AW07_01231 [Candidatus Accumulibacter sp. SK-11]|nr:MAG: hypothetical protein AW07_01231 [Candidatus Accumulibacter sp. SK-11]
MLVQGPAHGFYHQAGRIALQVGPQVHIDNHHTPALQLGLEIGLQEGGFACATRCGQKEAVGRVAEEGFALQGVCQLAGQLCPGVIQHEPSPVILFLIFYQIKDKKR